jgi:hypothetical protein
VAVVRRREEERVPDARDHHVPEKEGVLGREVEEDPERDGEEERGADRGHADGGQEGRPAIVEGASEGLGEGRGEDAREDARKAHEEDARDDGVRDAPLRLVEEETEEGRRGDDVSIDVGGGGRVEDDGRDLGALFKARLDRGFVVVIVAVPVGVCAVGAPFLARPVRVRRRSAPDHGRRWAMAFMRLPRRGERRTV